MIPIVVVGFCLLLLFFWMENVLVSLSAFCSMGTYLFHGFLLEDKYMTSVE